MKKLNTMITLIISIVILTSCEKEEDNSANNTVTEIPTKNKIQQNKTNGATSSWQVNCSGNCDNPDNGECHLQGWLGNGSDPTVVECSCEGCEMNYSGINGLPINHELAANLDYVVGDFNDYVNDNYPKEDIEVTTVSIYGLSDGSSVIQIDYRNSEQTINSNLSFKLEFNSENSSLSGKTVVDCSGSCDNSNETCRESFNTGTGDITCTCQGPCEMTITEVPTNG